MVYLTAATLVVVPDNLQMQWASEILKHCTDLLRVLVVKNKEELPDAPVLATDYDVSRGSLRGAGWDFVSSPWRIHRSF